MKKIAAFIFAIAILNVSIAISPMVDGAKPLNATEIMIPIGKTGQKISLAEFSKLKPKEYEKLANVKLGFFDRIAYRMAMKKLRKGIAEDGTIKNKEVTKLVSGSIDGDSGFHLGGFALGFLVGLIGVLIAYLINDDKKDNRVKWSWIGFAVWVGIILIAVLL